MIHFKKVNLRKGFKNMNYEKKNFVVVHCTLTKFFFCFHK